MTSFWQLWEQMQNESSPVETKAMKAVRTGLNLSEDFWDNFILICNNADAVADLLGVQEDKVRGWALIIRDTLSQVNSANNNPGEEDGPAKMINTGTRDE
jgi:hypothetical protein